MQHSKATRDEAKEAHKRTLAHFIEHHYKPWVLANRKSGENTLELLKRHFAPWYELKMTEITVMKVEKWRTERLGNEIQPATINRDVATLKAVLSEAVEWNALEVHPLTKLKPLRLDTSPKVRYLSQVEETRLLEALRRRDEEIKQARERGNAFRRKRALPLLPSLLEFRFADHIEPMVLLSLKTGMRRGELFDVLWSDVNLEASTITIRAEISKSNRTRHIPPSPTARAVLEDWRDQNQDAPLSARIFGNSKGERFDNTNKAWRAILKAAGIDATTHGSLIAGRYPLIELGLAVQKSGSTSLSCRFPR